MARQLLIPRKQRTRQHVIADLSVHDVEGFILDAGQEVVMDWAMTLSAPGNSPVALGKTKEGTFALRVATPLTSPDPGFAFLPDAVLG